LLKRTPGAARRAIDTILGKLKALAQFPRLERGALRSNHVVVPTEAERSEA
jgi:hypothetical protein